MNPQVWWIVNVSFSHVL
jgi:hypothetical protein